MRPHAKFTTQTIHNTRASTPRTAVLRDGHLWANSALCICECERVPLARKFEYKLFCKQFVGRHCDLNRNERSDWKAFRSSSNYKLNWVGAITIFFFETVMNFTEIPIMRSKVKSRWTFSCMRKCSRCLRTTILLSRELVGSVAK